MNSVGSTFTSNIFLRNVVFSLHCPFTFKAKFTFSIGPSVQLTDLARTENSFFLENRKAQKSLKEPVLISLGIKLQILTQAFFQEMSSVFTTIPFFASYELQRHNCSGRPHGTIFWVDMFVFACCNDDKSYY